MIKAAALNGWIDEKRIVMENMLAFKEQVLNYNYISRLDVANG